MPRYYTRRKSAPILYHYTRAQAEVCSDTISLHQGPGGSLLLRYYTSLHQGPGGSLVRRDCSRRKSIRAPRDCSRRGAIHAPRNSTRRVSRRAPLGSIIPQPKGQTKYERHASPEARHAEQPEAPGEVKQVSHWCRYLQCTGHATRWPKAVPGRWYAGVVCSLALFTSF